MTEEIDQAKECFRCLEKEVEKVGQNCNANKTDVNLQSQVASRC